MGGVPKVKGLVFRSVFDTLDVVRDPSLTARVQAALDGELGEAWRYGGIVASGWYPVAWYCQLWRTIRTFEDSDDLVRLVGRESMELDFRTYHKLILRMLSPATIMKIAQRVYTRYFDHGRIEVVESHPRRLRARWVDVGGFDDNLWIEHMSGAEHLVRLAAGDTTRIEILAGARGGDEHAEVVATW
ncbi:MAG: hypothetical protein H6719_18285 [Sandaracinaceae bacterium]|nr:hypothetical protein [Sandaracinaceae bacterium]